MACAPGKHNVMHHAASCADERGRIICMACAYGRHEARVLWHATQLSARACQARRGGPADEPPGWVTQTPFRHAAGHTIVLHIVAAPAPPA